MSECNNTPWVTFPSTANEPSKSRDKRKSQHVRNRDFSHSPRQIATFHVFRDKSRFSRILGQIAHFPLNLRINSKGKSGRFKGSVGFFVHKDFSTEYGS